LFSRLFSSQSRVQIFYHLEIIPSTGNI
jgi:hypothetical protein